MQASELLQRIKSNSAPVVIDARSEREFKAGHIAGAINAPVVKLLLNAARLPENKKLELLITCEHGPRAMIAQGLLGLRGYRTTELLRGHMKAWRIAGLPMEK